MSNNVSLGLSNSTIIISNNNVDSLSKGGEISFEENIQKKDEPPKTGFGALKERQIKLGDGEQRAEGRESGSKVLTGLKRFGQGILALVALPVLVTAGLTMGILAAGKKIGELVSGTSIGDRVKNREMQAESRFVEKNKDMIDALKTPQGNSVTDSQRVIDKLMTHAENTGKTLTRQEIKDLVVTGENIAKALKESESGKSPLAVTVGVDTHQVESNTYTSRALAWYMMASAAAQDVRRTGGGDQSGTSDMTTSGSFVMKDPGNKMFEFLNSAPTAGNRMSTHFEERLGHDKEHKILGFFPTFGTKPQQRGIEDFQSRMPGQGGTMLFDRLKNDKDGQGELFVKFESAGCPPLFSSDKQNNVGDKFLRFFASLDRNMHHVTNFLHSTKQTDAPVDDKVVSRQEHVYKGVLKNTVFDPVKELTAKAVDAGLVEKDAVSGVSKSMKKIGISGAIAMALEIEKLAKKSNNEGLLNQAQSVLKTIEEEMGKLGFASDHYGIERRGAEVHISIDPTVVSS